MIRLVVWALIIYVGYLLLKNLRAKQESGGRNDQKRNRGESTHRDPVCGVFVAEDDAVIGRHEGQRLYFCSMACLEKYQQQLSEK
jgi:YHS domain-containing protein